MINFDFHKYVREYVKKEDKIKYLDKAKDLSERFKTGDLEYLRDVNSHITKDDIYRIIKLRDYIVSSCDVFLVIGVGGSYMGTKAVLEALSPKYNRKEPEIIFLGNNLCSEEYYETLEYIKEKEVIVNVVSKSGSTLETSIAFDLINEFMQKKYTDNELKKRVIITTGIAGKLRDFAKKNGNEVFTLPDNIGGRFSVFTSVSLLPLAVAGINIGEFLSGMVSSFSRVDRAIEYAVIRDVLYTKGYFVDAITVYNSKLEYFVEWAKQLFAETQGKDNKGILPISSINTRDLHSLGQYLQEGKRIIFETIIGIDQDKKVMLNKQDMELNTLNKIVLDKVAIAHSSGHTPCNLITIDEKNEKTMGELMYYFMMVAIAGAYLIDVNPMDQPGVKNYKDLVNLELE